MTWALEGVDFKVIWAHKHLDELKRHVAMYVESKPPYALSSKKDGDFIVVKSPVFMVPPHLDIQGIIGDCLCAMMASLDYIIWELASRHAGRPLVPPPRGKDKPSFPIYSDPDAFKKRNWRGGMAQYNVPPEPLDAIESVQPYNAGYESLAQLHFLVNQDKHRLPLLVMGHMKVADLRITFGGRPATVAHASETSMTLDAPFPLPHPQGRNAMKVEAEPLAKFVAFHDPAMPREPVQVTLANILKCIESIQRDFVVFFV